MIFFIENILSNRLFTSHRIRVFPPNYIIISQYDKFDTFNDMQAQKSAVLQSWDS